MIPKRIWMYWDQGWENAPRLTRWCRNSWAELNPDYELVPLDSHTWQDFVTIPVDLTRPDIRIQKKANLIRMALLSQYGGVWIDATLMCVAPLSTWLDSSQPFFTFRNPGVDRLFSNWFIAANKDSVILQRFHKTHLEYFTNNRFTLMSTPAERIILRYTRERWSRDIESTRKWCSWFARKILRIYPYRIMHYLFNSLILDDAECRQLWNQVPVRSSLGPVSLQDLKPQSDGLRRAIELIHSSEIPLYKLDRRIDVEDPYWSAIFSALSERKERILRDMAS